MRHDRRTGRAPLAAIAAAAMAAMAMVPSACSSGGAPPATTARDPADGAAAPAARLVPQDASAVRQEYLQLTQKALDEVKAWTAAGAHGPDPRPDWGRRLEEFATAHPATPEAAEAIAGVMQMRASLRDTAGFFDDYALLLKTAPDEAAVPAVFNQISLMRMAEAGGDGTFQSMDYGLKQRVWRRAVPRIADDLQRAIDVTKNPATLAAAEYTIGLSWYQMDIDLQKALDRFRTVADRYPTWSYAESARQYVHEITTLGPGSPAPDFEAVAIDGRRVKLSDLAGRIVLVDFWATWCEPCMHELPNLKRAYDKYQANGFTIVGVSADTDKRALARFVASQKMGWPVIVADASGHGPADPIFRTYSVQAMPMSYLVDRAGKIRARALFGDEVERTVGELLAR